MTEISSLDIFKLLSANGVGAGKVNRMISQPGVTRFDFDSFRKMEIAEMRSMFSSLSEKDCSCIKAVDFDRVNEEYELLREAGVEIVAINTPEYPGCLCERLGPSSPPLLFCYGNVSVLERKGLAVVGSRRASRQAVDYATTIVERFADRDVAIVSGGAPGVDMAAHRAAVDRGMNTVVVLPHGILTFLKKSRAGFPSEDALAVSQFPPTSPWTPGLAMARNSTVCGLSEAVIVVEAGADGGSIEAGKRAMALGVPLLVVDPGEFETPPPGNLQLIKLGGQLFTLDDQGNQLF